MAEDEGWGRRVKQARLDQSAKVGRQLSQAAIAEIVGVHYKTLQSWEAGKVPDNFAVVVRLANALDTSPEYLAFGTKRGGRRAIPGSAADEKKA